MLRTGRGGKPFLIGFLCTNPKMRGKTLQRSLFYCLSKLGKSKCADVVVVVRGYKKYGLLKISYRASQLVIHFLF